MQIKFVTGANRMEYLSKIPEVKIVDVEQIEDSDKESYYVTYEFPEWYSMGLICQFFFHAGVTYGLDLKYSSYGTEPERVR